LDRRQLVSYTGNYSRYLELRQLRHERLAAGERQRRNLLKRELEWIRRTPMARGTKQRARRQRVAELQRNGLHPKVFALPCGHYTTGEAPFKWLDGYVLIQFLRRNL